MNGFVVWFTGLSAAGKSTIAGLVAAELEDRGMVVDRLDGDVVREHLTKDLGFSKEDRDTNIGRIGWVASRLARAGVAVVVSAISPYEEARQRARRAVEEHGTFVEVYVATSLEECERRDPEGALRKGTRGRDRRVHRRLRSVRGAVEPGAAAADTEGRTPEESAAAVMAKLEELGLLGVPA